MSQPAIMIEKGFTILVDELLPLDELPATRGYPFDLATMMQLRLTLRAGIKLEAWAFDLSKDGIGLNLPYALEVSTRIVVRLRGRQLPGLVPLLARIVRTAAQANGNWWVWCAFDKPLPKDMLDSLLRSARAPAPSRDKLEALL